MRQFVTFDNCFALEIIKPNREKYLLFVDQKEHIYWIDFLAWLIGIYATPFWSFLDLDNFAKITV